MFPFLKKLDREQKRLLYTCFYAFFVSGLVTLTLGSMMPDLKAAWGLTDTQGGVLLSAYSTGNLVAGFVSGVIPLYLGRRRSIAMLQSLCVIGMLMVTVFGAPALLFLAFLCAGTGRGSVTNFNNRMVNVLTDGDPAAANLLHGVFAVGAIVAPMIFLALRGLISWHAGPIFVALCGTISVINFSRAVVPDDHPSRADKANRSMAFMKEPAFLVAAAMMLFYICSEYAINGWLVTYLQHKEALTASFGKTGEALQAAIRAYSQTMATLLWAVILVGRLFCAWLSERMPVKRMILVASVGEVLAFAGMLRADSIPMVTLSVAVLGFCMAGICPMIYADISYYTNNFPLATGAMVVISAVGGMLMPTVVGVLADANGFSGGMAAILGAIVLLALFAVVNAVIRPKKNM